MNYDALSEDERIAKAKALKDDLDTLGPMAPEGLREDIAELVGANSHDEALQLVAAGEVADIDREIDDETLEDARALLNDILQLGTMAPDSLKEDLADMIGVDSYGEAKSIVEHQEAVNDGRTFG